MFSSQLRSSFAAQQLKNSADATDQQRLEALTSFGGFGLKPVEELLVIEESDRPKLWSPSERARVLSSLEKLRYIREADVPRGALAEVLDKIKLKSLVLGEYVFSQGDHNRSFYIVLSGQMQFCVPANKVRPAALGSSGLATLDGPAHPSPSPLLTAAHLAAHQGALAHSPLLTAAHLAAHQGALAHSPSPHARTDCADCTHARTHARAHAPPAAAWQATKVLGVAREGDGFGELGFITGKPRAVGARAATHCHLLVFDGELFSHLFSAVPERKVAHCPGGGTAGRGRRRGLVVVAEALAGVVVVVAGPWCGG